MNASSWQYSQIYILGEEGGVARADPAEGKSWGEWLEVEKHGQNATRLSVCWAYACACITDAWVRDGAPDHRDCVVVAPR